MRTACRAGAHKILLFKKLVPLYAHVSPIQATLMIIKQLLLFMHYKYIPYIENQENFRSMQN